MNILGDIFVTYLNKYGDQKRIIKALSLLKNYEEAKIVFSGGNSSMVDHGLDERKSFKKIVDNLFSKDKYFVLSKSRNTIENLTLFKKFNEKHKFKNVLLYTSPTHIKRSMLISKKIELNLIPYTWSINSKNKSKNIVNLYQNFNFIENLRRFDIFFHEMLGIVAVKLFVKNNL